jgi:hypothetical protein
MGSQLLTKKRRYLGHTLLTQVIKYGTLRTLRTPSYWDHSKTTVAQLDS